MTILDPIYQGAAPILVSAGGISIDQAADFNWSGKHVFTSVTTEDIDQHIQGNMLVDGFTLFGNNGATARTIGSSGGPNVLAIDELTTPTLGQIPNAIYARLTVTKDTEAFTAPMGSTSACADTDEAGAANSAPTMYGCIGRIEIHHKAGTHAEVACFRPEIIGFDSPAGTITNFYYFDGTGSINLSAETIEKLYGLNLVAINDGTIENWALKLNGGNSRVGNDGDQLFFGTADDASIQYDGADLLVDSAVVGTGRFVLDTALATLPATPATLTADVNDYDPGNTSVARLSSDIAGRTITGILAGRDGERLTIINIGLNSITIANENVASAAANRIITQAGADASIAANIHAHLIYDATSQRWRDVT